MRPIRLALPLCLLLGPGLADGAQPAQPVPVPPAVPPAPPAPPAPPPPPEFVAAMRAARDGEALLAAARFDEAIAHFRRTIEGAPPGIQAGAAGNLHALLLGYYLIRAGRLDSAEAELAWFAARPRPGQADAHGMLRINDLQLYLAAGRGDVARVLALLDARAAFAGSPHAVCPAGAYFPEVVAPAHHDPRVAARLRALGCWQSIIDQLDEIASRPIGANMYDRGLPPRRPPPPR